MDRNYTNWIEHFRDKRKTSAKLTLPAGRVTLSSHTPEYLVDRNSLIYFLEIGEGVVPIIQKEGSLNPDTYALNGEVAVLFRGFDTPEEIKKNFKDICAKQKISKVDLDWFDASIDLLNKASMRANLEKAEELMKAFDQSKMFDSQNRLVINKRQALAKAFRCSGLIHSAEALGMKVNLIKPAREYSQRELAKAILKKNRFASCLVKMEKKIQ